MPETAHDIAVFGSSPFAAILAGSLAREHGKRVLRIGSRASPQRLPRRLDLALPLATRPATWDLLIRGEAEIRALLRTIGTPESLMPMDVRIASDTEASSAFFGHVAHIALASGLSVTRKAGGLDLRGVPLLRAERAEDKIVEWLLAAGVRSIDPHEVRIEFRKSVPTLVGPDGAIPAGLIVLADDAAILALPADLRPTQLRAEELTSTLIGKMRSLGTPITLLPDRGVSLLQRDDGAVLALVSGNADIDARLASAFAGSFPIARLATGRSHHLVSTDGAPVIGALEGSALTAVAGLGNAAVFFAPALARHFAGAASASENAWILAHMPSRRRELVTEAVN